MSPWTRSFPEWFWPTYRPFGTLLTFWIRHFTVSYVLDCLFSTEKQLVKSWKDRSEKWVNYEKISVESSCREGIESRKAASQQTDHNRIQAAPFTDSEISTVDHNISSLFVTFKVFRRVRVFQFLRSFSLWTLTHLNIISSRRWYHISRKQSVLLYPFTCRFMQNLLIHVLNMSSCFGFEMSSRTQIAG